MFNNTGTSSLEKLKSLASRDTPLNTVERPNVLIVQSPFVTSPSICPATWFHRKREDVGNFVGAVWPICGEEEEDGARKGNS